MSKLKKEVVKETENDTKDENQTPWYKRWYSIVAFIVFVAMMMFNYNYAIILVNGESMSPNYHDGDILFSQKQYDYLNRFDVVIINSSKADHIIIKRVIGLPGETIDYIDNQLFVNGEYVEDRYGTGTTQNFTITLDENSYYCLGDNRENSYDSRAYGSFSDKEILAKVYGRQHAKLADSLI